MEVPTAHHHALRRAGVPFGLLAAPNARPPGSLRSPSVCAPNQLFKLLRCSAWLIHDFAPSPMRALVFRSAYSASRNARASAAFAASIKAHRAVSSETLMLQVRFARPPVGGGSSAPPCTPLSCPSRIDLSSVQKTPHLFSDGQTGGSSARTILFPLPG